MLRHAVGRSCSRRTVATTRWLTAATSRQKRALNPDQLKGTSGDAGGRQQSTPPPPPKPPVADSAGGGGGNLVPLGVVGLAAVGGAAYYYYNASEQPAAVVEKTTEKEVPATTGTKDAPAKENRVSSITIPDKMKNKGVAGSAVEAPTHPETGNRVTNMIVSKVKRSIDSDDSGVKDDSMTTIAVQKLKESSSSTKDAVLESHQSLWSTIDETFFADMDTLNTAQLKARIVQLATEMKDRTKWEAVRLKEFLAMKEKEVSDKYLEKMQTQRLEFEDLLAKRLREQENELSLQFNRALQEKDSTIQRVIDTALEAQQKEHDDDKKAFEEIITGEIQSAMEEKFGKQLEEYKSQFAQDLQKKVATIESLNQKLQHLDNALHTSRSSREGSNRAHRLSAAALALAEKLETNVSAASELAVLKKAAGNQGVIATACANIPEAVKTGVPTLVELQAKFETVAKKCRQAALVPEGRPGLEGQLAGILFATLKYPPNPDDPAPESDKDNAEYVLARAKQMVQVGQLEQAVDQLEKLTGQPAFTVQDWKKDAIDRIAVEKSLKVIKMECALLNESCVDED